MQHPSPTSGGTGTFVPKLHPDQFFPGGAGDDGELPPPDGHGGYGYTASLFAEDDAGAAEQQQQLVQAQGDERLALSYHGQVYVFDSVQPQKVQAILLLLNGQELAPQNVIVKPQAPVTDLVQPIVVPRNYDRLAALMRYKEKRKNLKFEKRVTYTVRSQVASRMKRKRGQFASSVESSDDSLPATADSQGETNEPIFCTNCGASSDATPMMRRGPNGSKTFCNACGLMWATKSKIRKATKPTSRSQEHDASEPDVKPNS